MMDKEGKINLSFSFFSHLVQISLIIKFIFVYWQPYKSSLALWGGKWQIFLNAKEYICRKCTTFPKTILEFFFYFFSPLIKETCKQRVYKVIQHFTLFLYFFSNCFWISQFITAVFSQFGYFIFLFLYTFCYIL